MAKQTKSNNALFVEYDCFEGIDTRRRHFGATQDLVNFRILPDGSLQKRQGFKCIYEAMGDIRALWSGVIGGAFTCYFLVGTSVYTLDLSTGTATLLGYIPESDSAAEFFYYGDGLYLTDCNGIYRITDDGISTVIGYVPLFGKDWGTGYAGEINEPLNLLHRLARITYKIEEGHSAYLPTLYPVKQIISLYKNGELLSDDAYLIDTRFNTIDVSDLETGDALEALVEFESDDGELRASLLSSTCAYVFGGINSSRLFMWGGELENTVFTSTYVSREALAKAEAIYPDCGHIYFRAGNQFTVGDGRYSIRAVTRHFDRLLLLTEGDAWIADSASCDQEEFPIMNVNSRTGCRSLGGVTAIGNDPVSVGDGAIFRWTSDTDELNECNAYSISEEISSLLPSSFFDSAAVFSDRRYGELWLCESDGDGTAWIYNTSRKAWSRFKNIHANAFFDANGSVGFINGSKICVFGEEYYSDYESPSDTSGKFILASLTSGIIDLGTPENKRLKRLICVAGLDGGAASLTLTTDRGEEIYVRLRSEGEHTAYSSRLHSHRHSFFSLLIGTSGAGRQTLQRLRIEAK